MKKKLLLALSLLLVLAAFCVPGMEARAATYVDDLPEGSSGTLKSGQIMTNNYGELRNYGLVHDNYGRMDNFGTTLHNHEDGEVYVYSGSVLENEGYLIYPVFFNDALTASMSKTIRSCFMRKQGGRASTWITNLS